MGGDYDVAAQKVQPKWQLDMALGKAVDVRVNEDGCTVSKNWDADLGALSCNVERKAHCSWSGRVRAKRVSEATHALISSPFTCAQPTLSIDAAPILPLTKAVTGGVAFAVGKSMDINPRVKLGKLPVKVRALPHAFCICVLPDMRVILSQIEVGASIYKEGADPGEAPGDVLCLRVRSIDAHVDL